MERKGQSLIFEQVLLFSFSVAIFIAAFTIFSFYQDFYVSSSSNNHLDQTKEWISSQILKTAEQSESTQSLFILPIPKKIENNVYVIRLTNEGLEVENIISNTTASSTLYSLGENFTLSGNVSSINGRITIKREDKQIIIS